MRSRVRAFEDGDDGQVLALWSSNIAEHLEVMSYDRWGPGVPVPARPGTPEVHAVTVDPREGVKVLLRRFLSESSGAFCLVAEDGGPDLAGFIVGAVAASLFDDSSIGVIGELYVRPDRRRRGLGSELVVSAVREFDRRGATFSKVEVPADWQDSIAFWSYQTQWEQDAVVFSRYD